MNREEVWRELADLPPEAQRQVADFVAFLRTRYAPPAPAKRSKKTSLIAEKFVGMWRDRADMQDSSAWVRNARRREWGEPHG